MNILLFSTLADVSSSSARNPPPLHMRPDSSSNQFMLDALMMDKKQRDGIVADSRKSDLLAVSKSGNSVFYD